jgi:hypothetical protein
LEILPDTTVILILLIKTNEELGKIIKYTNVVNCIKAQRLSLFCHVQRIPDTRTVKRLKWNPIIKLSPGIPNCKWEDNINQDICQMRVKNWIISVHDLGKWKEFVEKAKAFCY